jgi:hypothetical protein
MKFKSRWKLLNNDLLFTSLSWTQMFMASFFFFDKSMYYIKKRKGAQPLVHWGYTKGTRGNERTRKENLQS